MKKRKITDNIPLKIMSVAIAVVLWLIVVNIDNPTGTNYYTLNDVELINKEYVESSDTIGKMCMPEQNQDSIKVAITATKKIRDKIKVTDISAVADLQQAALRRQEHRAIALLFHQARLTEILEHGVGAGLGHVHPGGDFHRADAPALPAQIVQHQQISDGGRGHGLWAIRHI